MTTTTGTSTQSVLTSIITNGVICAAFVLGFILLRTKFNRIYQPKSSFDIVPENEKPEPLPKGPYQWIVALLKKPHSFVIQQAGFDGYLFLRYIFLMSCAALGGICTWPILLPVNATNGKGDTGLDQLSISNVGSTGRYYAHVFLSWIYYGFIMFMIYRELFFYSSLRSLIMSTPAYAKKLSSRVVIFQTVPDEYLDEEEFFKLFEGVKHVWVARGQPALSSLVKKRTKMLNQLENALNSLLKKAMKAKLKAEKKGTIIEPANEMVCYVPQNKRPTMRLKPIFGKKVDTIEYLREEIPKINEEIKKLQDNFKDSKPMNSIAVEFENQYFAQLAYQTTIHHVPLHMCPKFIGVDPADIFWPNMRIFWWERLFKSTGAAAAIVALLILWTIPVAFVGVISNLTYLTNKLPWLNFIYNLPTVLLGLITSLLPTILLALLMMLLPMFIRGMGKLSGCVSTQTIEYYTQQCYFAFQVIQVFLVTTISSSASSVVTQIIEEPTSVMSLLSSNLPKSSNFYVSYLILQGFSISGGALFQLVPFILFYVLGTLLDGTPRKKFNRFTSLSSYSWGTFFPIYTNLAVIFLTYAIISPIIMLFAFAGFALLYIAYLHNATYVFGKGTDSLGVHYPRALFQTMVGVYLGEICLLGIFAVSKSWGCIVLEAILIGFTVFFHVNLNSAFDNFLKVVPNSVMRPLDGTSETVSWKPDTGSLSALQKYAKQQAQEQADEHQRIASIDSKSPFYTNEEVNQRNRTLENLAQSKLNNTDDKVGPLSAEALVDVPLLADGADYTSAQKPANFLARYFQPHIFLSFHALKDYIPATFYDLPEVDEELERHAYDYPAVTDRPMVLWIPRDPMGLSSVEIEHLKGMVEVSDAHAYFNEQGKIIWEGAPPTQEDVFYEEDNKDFK